MVKVKNWQETLDELTIKIKEKGYFKVTTKSEKLILKIRLLYLFINNSYFRNLILNCLNHTLNERAQPKSLEKSINYRKRGNDYFINNRIKESLEFYSKSIIYAPLESEELALAFGNRSAALFESNFIQESINDIDRAINKGYPSELIYKLSLRKAKCYILLGKAEDAKNCLLECNKHLSESKNLDSSKRKSIEKEIEKLRKKFQDFSSPLIQIEETVLPEVSHGLNESFLHASEAIELKISKEKGRYVTSNKDINIGDILFVEKPYAFVILPEFSRDYCYHCCQRTLAPFPCSECTEAVFCNDTCLKEAIYHKFECKGGLQLLWSIGIAHLAERVLIRYAQSWLEASLLIKGPDLMDHLEDMTPEDLCQYSLTAALISFYLTSKTSFAHNINLEDTEALASRILHHIGQLVCNGHAITRLVDEDKLRDYKVSGDNMIKFERQVRIATALYPSASIMNHSCESNIMNSFSGEWLIVKAQNNIPKGQEVYNCYGPDFRRMNRELRREALFAQYFFQCSCKHCDPPVPENYYDHQEWFTAMRCRQCSGPLLSINDPDNEYLRKCVNCKIIQDCWEYQSINIEADRCFQDAQDIIKLNPQVAADVHLNKCLTLRQKILYKHHIDLSNCMDILARAKCLIGEYSEAAMFLKRTLEITKARFGPVSVEMGHELQKYSDVLLMRIQSKDRHNIKIKEQLIEALQQAKYILELNYGIWNEDVKELKNKIDMLS